MSISFWWLARKSMNINIPRKRSSRCFWIELITLTYKHFNSIPSVRKMSQNPSDSSQTQVLQMQSMQYMSYTQPLCEFDIVLLDPHSIWTMHNIINDYYIQTDGYFNYLNVLINLKLETFHPNHIKIFWGWPPIFQSVCFVCTNWVLGWTKVKATNITFPAPSNFKITETKGLIWSDKLTTRKASISSAWCSSKWILTTTNIYFSLVFMSRNWEGQRLPTSGFFSSILVKQTWPS